MTPQEEQAAAIGQIAKQIHRKHLSALWALIERKGTSTARIGPIAEELKIADIGRARRAMERLLDLGVIARDGPDTFKPLPWRRWRDRQLVRLAGASVYGQPLPFLAKRPKQTPPLADAATVELIQSSPFWSAALAASGEGVTIHHLAHARRAELTIQRSTTAKTEAAR